MTTGNGRMPSACPTRCAGSAPPPAPAGEIEAGQQVLDIESGKAKRHQAFPVGIRDTTKDERTLLKALFVPHSRQPFRMTTCTASSGTTATRL